MAEPEAKAPQEAAAPCPALPWRRQKRVSIAACSLDAASTSLCQIESSRCSAGDALGWGGLASAALLPGLPEPEAGWNPKKSSSYASGEALVLEEKTLH